MSNCLECNDGYSCTKCDSGFEIKAGVCKEPEMNIFLIAIGIVGGMIVLTSLIYAIAECCDRCNILSASKDRVETQETMVE